MIESNSHAKFDPTSVVCWNHRNQFGKLFLQEAKCAHPFHEGPNAFKRSSLRQVQYETYKSIKYNYGNFALSSLLCKVCHVKPLKDNDPTEISLSTDDFFSNSSDETNPNSNEKTQENFQMDIDDTFKNINQDLACHGYSPIKYKRQKTNFADYSSTAQITIKHKYEQYMNIHSQKFANAAAPGDPDGFLESVSKDLTEVDNPEVLTLPQLQYLYEKASDGRAKLAILTLATCNYSNRVLVKELGCSMRQIKNARQIFETSGICAIPKKGKFTRIAMNPDKIRTFLQYLFASRNLKIAAYGTAVQKYSMGLSITVPKPVLIGCELQVIQAYQQHCVELGVKPLSQSSCYTVLNTLKPTKRAIVCCLDNFLVEGQESIETIIDIVKDLQIEDSKNIIDRLEKIERYIKTNYVHRLSDESPILSHCIKCALSDDTDKSFSEPCKTNHSNEKCLECENIVSTLEIVEEYVNTYTGKFRIV